MLALSQHPGHADLCGRGADALADRADAVDDRAVGGHRLVREAGIRRAEVVARELLIGAQRSGQEPAAEDAEGHERDAVVPRTTG